MKNFDLAEHLYRKGIDDSDRLWNKGKEFTLIDDNNKPILIEEYGSYVNLHHNFGGSGDHAYSDYDENFDSYGSRRKLFFRVQSEFFKELIEEKKNNPNCSYVTSVDALLEDGFIPEKFSAILQEEFHGRVDFQAVEKVGAKMLNFFSVPTIYCAHLAYKEDDLNQEFTVSPDFLRPNEIMMNLNEYMQQYVFKDDYKYIKDQTLEEFTSCYKKILKSHYKKVKENGFEIPDKKLINEKFDQWKENLSYMMLVKKYALGDRDFLARNLGVVINTQTNDINMAPAFDLELMGNQDDVVSYKFLFKFNFEKESGEVNLKKWIDEFYLLYYPEDREVKAFIDDIKFIQKNCPQVLTKFIKKADELLVSVDDKPCKLDEFLQEFCKDANENEDQDEQYKEDFKEYFKLVRDVCEVFANESQAEMGE